jgi:hypothetical protein
LALSVAPLFSVAFDDAVIDSASMTLSTVRIHIQRCQPSIQHARKDRQRIRTAHRNPFLKLKLFSILAFGVIPATYSLPGTQHVILVAGEHSNDTSRQRAYANTVIDHTVSAHTDTYTLGATNQADDATTTTEEKLHKIPYWFVADTESVPHVLDTGANRIILNDAKLFTKFTPSKGRIQGIGGDPVALGGMGSTRIPLKSDNGLVDYLEVNDDAYVPSSPYNLVPPQILIEKLKAQGYQVKDAKHDDRDYTFRYKPSPKSKSLKNPVKQVLTVPIAINKLFTVHSNEGYSSFFQKAQHFNADYRLFAGASHVIPDNEVSESAEIPRESEILRESPKTPEPEKPRESPELTPQRIPFMDEDFHEQLKEALIDAAFDVQQQQSTELDNPAVAMVKRKQARLATIHERLGHTSYSQLKLMARAGLIHRDLTNVNPPTFPGCAYDKAHRRSWRQKGIRNRRKLQQATAVGQVVSIDQLVSPTAGFVPTHRGTPTVQRYVGATVFVDHHSDFTYVHLMIKMNAETTAEAKLAFERVAASYGATVRHYHSDNGLFDTKAFKASISKAGQTLSFCGVNAHHQNGKTKNRIKDITTGGRTALLHAAHHQCLVVARHHQTLFEST